MTKKRSNSAISVKERLSRRGRKSRRKGHSFERLVAQLFRRWFPEARRGLQYRDGKECCDVEGTPYWIECKRRAKYFNPYGNPMKSGYDGRTMLLVWKIDRQPIMVCVGDCPCSEWVDFATKLDKQHLRASATQQKGE